ncbi:hypothetical protein B566_EDAN011952 [Ephemera danica]|nr:hypothetical protein B566_EDAN011952 [Ephemera danica]
MHVEGYNTPTFDGNGFVTGLDNTGSMISDMRRYLDAAQAQNIVVIFVLWNGAVMSNQNVNNLPMVSALAGHRALGAWEIMNEPEGSVAIQSNANPCSDTTALGGSGAGFQLFINWQADAIRSTDPNTLITLGSWSEQPQSSTLGKYNYYTDACLTGVGGRSGGYIDFYQIHTYSWQGAYASSAPFKGAMSWHYAATGDCTDSQQVQNDGFNYIRNYNDPNNGGLVDFTV